MIALKSFISVSPWPIRTLIYSVLCMVPVANFFLRDLEIRGLTNYSTIEKRRNPVIKITDKVKHAALYWYTHSKVTTDTNKNRYEAILAPNHPDYHFQYSLLQCLTPNYQNGGLEAREHANKRKIVSYRFPKHFQ